MKKYYLLSVLFLLTACGGGDSVGNKDGKLVIDMHNRPATGTPSRIKNANAKVTTMETFINNSGEIIAAVRNANINIAGTSSGRRISTQQSIDLAAENFYGGTTYATALNYFKKMYEIANNGKYTTEQLNDAYKLAGGKNTDANETVKLQFVKDNADNVVSKYFNTDAETGYDFSNPIFKTLEDVEFKMVNSGNPDTRFTFTLDDEGIIRQVDISNYDSETIVMQRDNKTENFANSDGYSATWHGLGNNKLSYSDFGYIEITDNNIKKNYAFAGGYTDKNIIPRSGAEYIGTAVATVYAKDTTGGNVDFEGTKVFTTNDAVLNTTDDSQTITMPFSKDGYYDVSVTKYYDGPNDGRADIEFSNFATNGDAHYQFKGDTSIEGFANSTNQNADMNFYGVNDTSSEATGVIRYNETVSGENGSEREFQAAYGLIQTK